MVVLLRKPSVAKGTKIVDKMLRQIDNEIALFEATHAKNVAFIEKSHTKYDTMVNRYIKVRDHIYVTADKLSTLLDKVAFAITDIGDKKLNKLEAKAVAAKEQNLEHTADIQKLSRIRDKVATLAD